jgi:hypothetical protein
VIRSLKQLHTSVLHGPFARQVWLAMSNRAARVIQVPVDPEEGVDPGVVEEKLSAASCSTEAFSCSHLDVH